MAVVNEVLNFVKEHQLLSAAVGVVGGAVVALVLQSPQPPPATTEAAEIECLPALPSVEQSPLERKNPDSGFYTWVPTDFRLVDSKFEIVPAHVIRKPAGKREYVRGHWDTTAGHCVWVPGTFLEEGRPPPPLVVKSVDHQLTKDQ